MDRSLIEAYESAPAKLRRAVQGLTREELTARPGRGSGRYWKWSFTSSTATASASIA